MNGKKIYRGISFTNYKQSKTISMADVELVKRDLMNHIYTAIGSRIKMPRFGTVIPDIPFEQLDDHTMELIEESIRLVINYDPRVEFMETDETYGTGVTITPLYDDNIIIASAEVRYVELNLTETLHINLEFSK